MHVKDMIMALYIHKKIVLVNIAKTKCSQIKDGLQHVWPNVTIHCKSLNQQYCKSGMKLSSSNFYTIKTPSSLKSTFHLMYQHRLTFSLIHISTLPTCSLNLSMSLSSTSPLPRLFEACSSSFHLDVSLWVHCLTSSDSGCFFFRRTSACCMYNETQ